MFVHFDHRSALLISELANSMRKAMRTAGDLGGWPGVIKAEQNQQLFWPVLLDRRPVPKLKVSLLITSESARGGKRGATHVGLRGEHMRLRSCR